MGYRAQVVTQHRNYGSTIFYDWDSFITYFNSLREEYQDREDIDTNFHADDDETFFEIPRDVLELEVKKLEKLKPEGREVYGEQMDNECLLENIKDALKEAPKDDNYIAVEWY